MHFLYVLMVLAEAQYCVYLQIYPQEVSSLSKYFLIAAFDGLECKKAHTSLTSVILAFCSTLLLIYQHAPIQTMKLTPAHILLVWCGVCFAALT